VVAATKWTEGDIPDQTGRVVLITGANSGIGWEAARALAENGARVVLACRTRSKAEDARARILEHAPGADVDLVDLDLSDLASVREAAARVTTDYARLDVLVNNAGIMAVPDQRTADGFEMQFGTNHLGHFAFTGLVLPVVLPVAGSRIVNVSSGAHKFGRIDLDDPNWERKRYAPWRAYGQSKLANLLFTAELQRRLAAAGVPTIAVACHPGGSRTNLGTAPDGLKGRMMEVVRPAINLFMQPAQMGALPTERAAVDPGVHGGEYYGPDGFAEQRGHPVRVDSNDRSKDAAVAARLWSVSEELTGVRYALSG
jgi:NAD(P)-dependent dehydrogenase (short-subunit alcohol dehydrogenase family)